MTRPALAHSPLGTPPPVSRALEVLVPGPTAGRRMRALLGHLLTSTHGFSAKTLERQFGTHVHELLKPLKAGGFAEEDLGGRIRLTVAGRNLARHGSRAQPKCSCCKNVPRPGLKTCETCAENTRRFVRNRKAKGICIRCPKPARTGFSLCQSCADHNKAYVAGLL